MLEPLFGNISKERILIFLFAREKGYAREIAAAFEAPVTPIQRQLENLEADGVLYSEPVGRTIVYALNPRYAFHQELKALLERAMSYYPPEQRELLLMNRRRPRRQGKPLTI